MQLRNRMNQWMTANWWRPCLTSYLTPAVKLLLQPGRHLSSWICLPQNLTNRKSSVPCRHFLMMKRICLSSSSRSLQQHISKETSPTSILENHWNTHCCHFILREISWLHRHCGLPSWGSQVISQNLDTTPWTEIIRLLCPKSQQL